MTVLQALNDHYGRLVAENEAPSYGYSDGPVSYAIVLSPDGKAVDVMPLLDTSSKKPSRRTVPKPAIRTVNIVSNFLWDKTAYVLGVKFDKDKKRQIQAKEEHKAFKALHEDLLKNESDPGLTALRAFLDRWQAEKYEDLPHANDMTDTNIVFRLDGEQCFLHERPAAQSVWRNHLAKEDHRKDLCLVTGEYGPTAQLHPKIKGIKGAQSSGASIVSFNLEAFESFDKNQGGNAPVSERAAFAYTTALNTLLAPDSRRRVRIGDTTTVFWAEASGDEASAKAAEDLFSILADPPSDDEEAAKVKDKLSAVAEGQPLSDIEPEVNKDSRFYVLGLAPNASRISVRFWCQDSIGTFVRRIGEHWRDLRLEPTPWKKPPAAWRLLRATAVQGKADNIPPALGGALMRAILTGSRYPQSLLAAAIARMRADREINGLQAAICKACLARDYRLGFGKEDIPVSLKPDEINPAYRLGRLFAIYESVQRAALGKVNATIKDRYFGAASTTPASVFPLLERNSVHHIASLRKNKGGLAHWFEREIDAILAGMDTTFPRSLRLEDQGRFAIGYHHQKATKHTASDSEDENNNTESHDEEQP